MIVSVKFCINLLAVLADKSAQKTCLIGTDGRQIDPLNSTIVPRMADKSVELIYYMLGTNGR